MTASIINKTIKSIVAASAALIMAASVAAWLMIWWATSTVSRLSLVKRLACMPSTP